MLRCSASWRRPRRPVEIRTYTDDTDDGCLEVIVDRKSAGYPMTSFPVGLGSRPPCLGQECSPIRSTPCGAGRETGSSAATAGTTSSGAGWRRSAQYYGRLAAFGRQRRRRSAPSRRHTPPVPDVRSPAVVQRQSHRKISRWIRRHATPEVEKDDDDVAPVSGHRSTPQNQQLKRKLIRGEADSGVKRRLTDSDSCCSLPSGTFTSDDEEDEVDDSNDDLRHADCPAAKHQSNGQHRVFPAAPTSPAFRSALLPRLAVTSPRWKKRSPFVDVVSSRRRRTRMSSGGGDDWGDVSSGALGDRSSSLGTSGDLALYHRHRPTVNRAPKTTSASRKNVVERRRAVLRRVTRMTRRLHRVAAADAASGIHVQTLAVL